MPDDTEKLLRYAQEHDEDAFAGFVRDNLTLVYSAGYRQVFGDAHLAEEVTQSVFIAAARNASSLSRHPVIRAWLHQATRNAAIDALRAQRSRREREREASLMTEAPEKQILNWEQVSPELDRAVAELSREDREAVVLRFFGDASFSEIGGKLGLSENTARMRVDRALEKLRKSLSKRVTISGTAALAALLTENAAVAAPVGLAANVSSAAIAAPAFGVPAILGVTHFFTAMKLVTAVASIVALAGIAAAYHEFKRANAAELAFVNASKSLAVAEAAGVHGKSAGASQTGSAGKGGAAPATQSKPAGGLAAVLDILSNPLIQQQQSVLAKSRLDSQYGPLFKSLKLSPAQVDAFKNLIVEKQMAGFDTMSAANDQGIDLNSNPKALYMAVAATEKDVDGKISTLIGSDDFSQFEDYQQTIPARNTTQLLQEAMSYTDTPLTNDQAAAVTKVLTDAGTPVLPVSNPFAVFNSDLGVTQVSEQGQAQLQSILSAPQFQALTDKIQQQAQIAQMRKRSAR